MKILATWWRNLNFDGFCALAPNPMTAADFLYVENIVQTNHNRLGLIREIKTV
jgi:hypothetical protein